MRGVCESCGGATNKGNVRCCRCRHAPRPTPGERSELARASARVRWDRPREAKSQQPGYISPSKRGTCSRCGKTVYVNPASSRPPDQRVCLTCRRVAPAPYGRKIHVPQPATCPVCTCEFLPNQGQRRVSEQVYCSRSCARTRNRKSAPRDKRGRVKDATCPVCGERFFTDSGRQSTCGRECGVILRYGRPAQPKAPKVPKIRHLTCEYCGTVFTTKYPRQKVCSAECRRLNVIRRTMERYRSDPAFRDRVISRAQNRAAGKLGAGKITTPATLVIYLMERDRKRCGICREPIRAKTGPRRPSIDHIVPLSRGGKHELANLQIAHYRCNLSKNCRGGGEQLALIG